MKFTECPSTPPSLTPSHHTYPHTHHAPSLCSTHNKEQRTADRRRLQPPVNIPPRVGPLFSTHPSSRFLPPIFFSFYLTIPTLYLGTILSSDEIGIPQVSVNLSLTEPRRTFLQGSILFVLSKCEIPRAADEDLPSKAWEICFVRLINQVSVRSTQRFFLVTRASSFRATKPPVPETADHLYLSSCVRT